MSKTIKINTEILDVMLNNKQFFPALTGFRAIAAWIIFIYHFFPFKNSNHNYPKWIESIISEFHIGVDMFFVLSGFLITYRYFDQNPINFKKYMVNRFARIYPMYFLLTCCVFLVGYFQTGWSLENTIQAILSFTMTKALFSDYMSAGISQGWTLTLEEMFYLSAPLFFILIKRSRWWLYSLPLIIFGISSSAKIIFEWGGVKLTNTGSYSIEFIVGMALALFIKKNNFKPKYPIITYIGIIGILIYLLGFNLRNILGVKTDLVRFLEMGILSITGVAPLLWGLINERTFIQKVLSLPIMILLGKASYIFYLIHKGFIPIFINDYIGDNKLFIFIILNIISIILFKYIEEPLNHWIRNKYGKK